jgi:DNA mismatch repair ATPase MutS
MASSGQVAQLIAKFSRDRPDARTNVLTGPSSEYNKTLFGALFPSSSSSEHEVSITSASALLAHLQKAPHCVLPTEVSWFNLSKSLKIDYDSLLALNIFTDQSHPNMHIGKSTQGLCLHSTNHQPTNSKM